MYKKLYISLYLTRIYSKINKIKTKSDLEEHIKLFYKTLQLTKDGFSFNNMVVPHEINLILAGKNDDEEFSNISCRKYGYNKRNLVRLKGDEKYCDSDAYKEINEIRKNDFQLELDGYLDVVILLSDNAIKYLKDVVDLNLMKADPRLQSGWKELKINKDSIPIEILDEILHDFSASC